MAVPSGELAGGFAGGMGVDGVAPGAGLVSLLVVGIGASDGLRSHAVSNDPDAATNTAQRQTLRVDMECMRGPPGFSNNDVGPGWRAIRVPMRPTEGHADSRFVG